MSTTLISTERERERVILVGVDRGDDEHGLDVSLAELARLTETDGGEVVATLTQRLEHPSPRTFLGKGKTEELVELVRSLGADVVVFDDELSPSQQSNLEHLMDSKVKVIDRTALILDIFAGHARTSEGRLQVELAQLTYLYPRLRGMWSHLVGEQTRGGIGSRFGQGESQLEVDRRLVRKRIARLKKDLERLDLRRSTQRKARWDSDVYRVALVGYTNAGKSSLLNYLTGSNVYVQDELFATLDPTTRALVLSEGRKITITDTVGFIQKLPTLLIESFKSTLAEVSAADLILKVVDVSDTGAARQLAAVEDVLGQIDASEIDSVVVCNKCDLLQPDKLQEAKRAYPNASFISALKGTGIDSLLFTIAAHAAAQDESLTVLIPYEKGHLMSMIHERGQIIHERYEQDGLFVTARIPRAMADMMRPYVSHDMNNSENTISEEAAGFQR